MAVAAFLISDNQYEKKNGEFHIAHFELVEKGHLWEPMRRREKLLFGFAAENFSGGQGLENVPVSELDSLLVLVAVNVSKNHFALLDDACPCGFRIDTNAARVGDLDPKAFTAFVLLVQRRGAELYEVAFVDFRQLGRIGDEEGFGMLFILRNGIQQGGFDGGVGEFLGTRKHPKLRAIEVDLVAHGDVEGGFDGFEDGIEFGLEAVDCLGVEGGPILLDRRGGVDSQEGGHFGERVRFEAMEGLPGDRIGEFVGRRTVHDVKVGATVSLVESVTVGLVLLAVRLK